MDYFDAVAECQRAAAYARTLAADVGTTAGEITTQLMEGGFNLEALAYGFASEAASRAHRDAVRAREHEAARRATPRRNGHTLGAAPRVQPAPIEPSPEAAARAAAVERDAKARWDSLMTQIQDDIHDKATSLAGEMVVEWTRDLLASTFALPDGSRVSWGDATAADHRVRVDMLVKQASGTVETAALHQKALQELGAAGVQRLSDLPEAVAA